METGDIIKKYRIKKGLTQEQLGEIVGVQKSAIAKYESGRVENLKRATIETLANFFNVSPSYILGINSNSLSDTVRTLSVMSKSVPVYGSIPAGVPMEAIEDRLDNVEIPSWLESKKDLFGLVIVGESMNKVLPSGVIGVFQKTCDLENGEVGAILVNGYDATVKKFYKLTDSIVLEPVSYETSYEPMIIKDEPVTVIGKLLWYCPPGMF